MLQVLLHHLIGDISRAPHHTLLPKKPTPVSLL